MTIPLSLLFFTSTKQHYGFKDVYRTTLCDLDRQFPLIYFGELVAHIKVSPGEESLAEQMEADLINKGFRVIKTVAAWNRGASHQQEYLRDVIRMSKEECIYSSEYVMWLEDDSTLTCNKDSLSPILSRMMSFVGSSPDHLSSRFIRRSDYEGGVPSLLTNADHFISPFTDFQPAIWRSRDFYLIAKMIEDHWGLIQSTQCEAVWRIVSDPLSRHPHKHMVWLPDYAESIHLGTPNYPALKKQLSL